LPSIRSQEQIDQLHPLEPEESLPFIREIFEACGGKSVIVPLWFVGALTLAAYAIEGKVHINIKRMAFSEPTMLHQF